MHQDKYVFSQLVSFLDWSKFNRIVAEYDGDKYVKFFTCWNQLLAQNRDYYIFEPFVLLHVSCSNYSACHWNWKNHLWDSSNPEHIAN